MRFVFVHGTGVRKDRHDALFARVSDRLSARFPGADVTSCFWGERHGASPEAGRLSIPGGARTRGATDDLSAAAPPDVDVAGWALLLMDPLCELRIPAETGWGTGGDGADDYAMPGVLSAGAGVLGQLADIRVGPPEAGEPDELTALLRETNLYDRFPDALEDVLRSEEAAGAAGSAVGEPAARELAVALARAVVAAALAEAGPEAECLGSERDRLVELVTGRLGGEARVPGGRAAAVLGKLAMRVTTQPYLNARRGALTGRATPFIGDILRYQSRGAALRDELRAHITDGAHGHQGPTVLIGHSLGGIALVDLFALSAAAGEELLPGPHLLVTVGSQAPFLYEIGALTSVGSGEGLPPGFPPWLNIYDRQDLLSFLAEPVFPGDPRVTDHEVGSGQPFPPSHSAYWKQDAVYDRIADAVAALG